MLTLVDAAPVILGQPGISCAWSTGTTLTTDVQPLVILYVIPLVSRVGVNKPRHSGCDVMSVAWTERSTSLRGNAVTKAELSTNLSEAREAITDELSRHPSVLARLVALASYWDEKTGTYHHKLAAHYGAEEIDRTLRRLHQEVFVAWLTLPLRQQQADVTIYLSALGIKAEWFDFRKMGKSCLPQTATLPERDLFLLDLDLIQGLTRY
jgi:hypothetical protein